MNIHRFQLFWCQQKRYRVLTHPPYSFRCGWIWIDLRHWRGNSCPETSRNYRIYSAPRFLVLTSGTIDIEIGLCLVWLVHMLLCSSKSHLLSHGQVGLDVSSFDATPGLSAFPFCLPNAEEYSEPWTQWPRIWQWCLCGFPSCRSLSSLRNMASLLLCPLLRNVLPLPWNQSNSTAAPNCFMAVHCCFAKNFFNCSSTLPFSSPDVFKI